MRARDVTRDGKPEARAALILIAGVVEAQERLEHVLAHRRRNARPVVVDRDAEPAVVAVAGDGDGRSKARGIADEIGDTALERGRPHRDFRLAVEAHSGAMAVALAVELELVEERRNVGRGRLFASIAA